MKKKLTGFRIFTSLVLAVSAFAFSAVTPGASNKVYALSCNFYLTPNSQTVSEGDSLTVEIRADIDGENVNAVTAYLEYPADKLQFSSIDSTTSAFETSIEGAGGSGVVEISRSSSSTHTGDVLVSKVTFTAISNTGSAEVTFSMSNSSINRASDNGNVLASTQGGTYSLAEGEDTEEDTSTNTSEDTGTNELPQTGPGLPTSGLLSIASGITYYLSARTLRRRYL